MSKEEITRLYEVIMGEKPRKKDVISFYSRMKSGTLSLPQFISELTLSAKYLLRSVKSASDVHLYYAHQARVKLVMTQLPKAATILDLGGANGSIYEMGYPHKFEEIIVVDLLPEDRVEMYKNLELKAKKTPNGLIKVHYGDMSDLSFQASNSVDLVWSGESIEHITPENGLKMLRESYRVLRPGGFLCLDTPNRLITKIHTEGAGVEFIHPEHKIEYRPSDLQKMLRKVGFKILEAKGICEMRNTAKNKSIDYSDFILGAPISDNVNISYMQYYCCQKPFRIKQRVARKIPAKVRNKIR